MAQPSAEERGREAKLLATAFPQPAAKGAEGNADAIRGAVPARRTPGVGGEAEPAGWRDEQSNEREKLLRRFGGLFGITAAQQRGKALEQILNDYFKFENLHVRDSFHIVGNNGEGIVEQIDGAIELDGHLFIVEMKWLSEKVGPEPAGYFLSKVFSRSDCGGILIAHPGATPAAVRHFETALQGKRTVFICTLQEVFGVLNSGDSLTEHLRQRRQRAILDGQPSLE
jgi:restriction system protein